MPSKRPPPPDPLFVFQHGWGFSGSCWQGWRKRLETPPLIANRGYWGAPCPAESQTMTPGFILVCHSLGLHLLPQHFLAQAGLLVIISGFAHFHGQRTEDGRFTRRHIHRMLSRISHDPTGLLRDFYRDCDCPDWPFDQAPLNSALLTNDLELLNESNFVGVDTTRLFSTLLIHGRRDRIVRPERAEELAREILGAQVKIIDDAGHGLPFSHPNLCLDLVLEAYGNLPT